MPVYHWFGRPQRIPFDDIAFIASSDEPDLLLQIHIAEQHFETALEVLRIRSEKTEGLLNSQEIQIEQFEFDSGKARINAPPQTVFGLRKATDSLYDVFDKALPKLLGEGQALEGFIRRKYKGVKPLRLLVPE